MDLLCTVLLIIAALAGTGVLARVAYRLASPTPLPTPTGRH